MNDSKRSLHVPGVTHGNVPIPLGARVGPLIASSGIAGKDPATDKVATDPADQARLAFANMEALVRAGGGTPADIARVTVFVKDDSVRPHVNAAWLAMFPDADDRPARHTQLVDLQHGMVLQLEMLAFVQERR